MDNSNKLNSLLEEMKQFILTREDIVCGSKPYSFTIIDDGKFIHSCSGNLNDIINMFIYSMRELHISAASQFGMSKDDYIGFATAMGALYVSTCTTEDDLKHLDEGLEITSVNLKIPK